MSPKKALAAKVDKAAKSRHRSRKLDSAWKDVIERFFKDLMALLFPRIYDVIDFSKKIEFLNTTMRPVEPFGDTGDRIADVLVKVKLKSGEYDYIYLFIHIEVQSQYFEKMMERLYIYNYRYYDRVLKYGIPVISMLILTDENENYRPYEHKFVFSDFKLSMEVPMVKILDFQLNQNLRDRLAKSTSPIALVIRTQLKSIELKKADDETKFAAAKELVRECYKEGYSREEIHTLIKFLVWVIRTSKKYEELLKEEIRNIEEERNMSYMLPWEVTAEKRGMRKGRKEGMEKGMEKGRNNEKRETAKKMFELGIDIDKIMKATGLKKETIKKLAAETH